MQEHERLALEKTVNDSGFPLQLGIATLVGADWKVSLVEHAWQDPLDGSQKFIDMVLRGKHGPQRLVVECKRARDTNWIFLRDCSNYPNANARSRLRARMIARYEGLTTPIDDWLDVQYIPGSPEANFCVVRKKDGRKDELLEKTAAEVARATEALARQELLIQGRLASTTSKRVIDPGLARLYIPVIVTTAKMFICDADYSSVDLASGEIKDATISPAPIVRFRKSLALDNPQTGSAHSVEDFSEQNERSVLVIQADALAVFLERADVMRTTTDAALLHALFGQ